MTQTERSAEEILGSDFIAWYREAMEQWRTLRPDAHFVEGRRAALRICWNQYPPEQVGQDVFLTVFGRVARFLDVIDAEVEGKLGLRNRQSTGAL